MSLQPQQEGKTVHFTEDWNHVSGRGIVDSKTPGWLVAPEDALPGPRLTCFFPSSQVLAVLPLFKSGPEWHLMKLHQRSNGDQRRFLCTGEQNTLPCLFIGRQTDSPLLLAISSFRHFYLLTYLKPRHSLEFLEQLLFKTEPEKKKT